MEFGTNSAIWEKIRHNLMPLLFFHISRNRDISNTSLFLTFIYIQWNNFRCKNGIYLIPTKSDEERSQEHSHGSISLPGRRMTSQFPFPYRLFKSLGMGAVILFSVIKYWITTAVSILDLHCCFNAFEMDGIREIQFKLIL